MSFFSVFNDEFLFEYLHIVVDFIIMPEVTKQISFSRLDCERFWDSKLPDIIQIKSH